MFLRNQGSGSSSTILNEPTSVTKRPVSLPVDQCIAGQCKCQLRLATGEGEVCKMRICTNLQDKAVHEQR